MVLISANTAPTPIPINFSGIEMSQTSGHSTSASKAKGQHNTNRISQPTRDHITFTCSSPCQWVQLISCFILVMDCYVGAIVGRPTALAFRHLTALYFKKSSYIRPYILLKLRSLLSLDSRLSTVYWCRRDE